MHVPMEAGMGWVHIAHKNADLLLLVSIASLGLLPLVSLHFLEADQSEDTAAAATTTTALSPSVLQDNDDNDDDSLLRSTPKVFQSCLRGLLYLAILFPYLLALLSTYVSIQLIRGQSLDDDAVRTNKQNGYKGTGSCFWRFQKYTKVLCEDDAVEENETNYQHASSAECSCGSSSSSNNNSNNIRTWRVPSPGVSVSIESPNLQRLVQGDCAICMHPYQAGERIIWASNPKCIHVYHSSCLEAWMEPWNAQTRRCPCCRQVFFQ